jgi:hypothetical protein
MKKTFTALVLAAMMATTAHAQPGSRLALGAGVGFQNYRDGAFSGRSTTLVPEYHFGLTPHSDRQGLSFGLKGGLGYSRPDRSDFIGGFETSTGSLRVFSVMVGAGPSYRSGPLRIGVGVVAGPSFNSFTVDDAARAAYRDRLGATLNSIDVKNSVVVRPDVSLWYNFTDRMGLHSSVSYTTNRPIVETTVDGVRTRTRWNADRWSYQAGLAFGVF